MKNFGTLFETYYRIIFWEETFLENSREIRQFVDSIS